VAVTETAVVTKQAGEETEQSGEEKRDEEKTTAGIYATEE
jgi:hypothetical protein